MPRIVDYPRRGKTGVRRWLPSWRLVLGGATACFLLLVIAFSVVYASVQVPDPNKLVTANASVVYWSDGKTEMGQFAEVNRQSVALADVPESAQHAVLAAEDRTFYTNHGFSPKGIARSVWVKITGGSKQGGSTITQQYVKNYYLTQQRTYTRKVKELVISLKLAQSESKGQVLQNYLNTIYFGRGAYGIETASEAYFGIPASKLSVSQGALLAAIIRSPGLYDPITQKSAATARWTYVLDGMVAQGWLTQAERDQQVFPKVIARKSGNSLGGTTGYLLEVVRQEVKSKAGLTDADIDRGGLRIVSTFDKKSQAAAVKAIKDAMPTTGDEGVRVGLAAVKPGDGAVLAMYGGPDAVKQPLNAATQSIMQAGSTFKPFALAAALKQDVSLRSTFDGRSPQDFPGGYRVSNFGGEQFGQIDLLTATASSVNTAYVGLNEKIGPKNTMDAAIKAGLPRTTAGLKPNLANVLGTSSPHVIDVADAFATFAAQGKHAPAYTVRSVTMPDGKRIYTAAPRAVTAFTPDVMADLTYALQGVVQRGSGAFARNLGRPAAGKTGTSQDSKSAWFSGFTPQLAASVGMYREKDGVPASLSGLGGRSNITGGSFPVQVWTAFMRGALDGAKVEQFPQPAFVGKVSGEQPTTTPTETPTETPTGTPTETPTETPTGTPTEPTEAPTTPQGPPTTPVVPPPTTVPAQQGDTQAAGARRGRSPSVGPT